MSEIIDGVIAVASISKSEVDTMLHRTAGESLGMDPATDLEELEEAFNSQVNTHASYLSLERGL